MKPLRLAVYYLRLLWAEWDAANFRADVRYYERYLEGAREQLALAEQRAALARQGRNEVNYPLPRQLRIRDGR